MEPQVADLTSIDAIFKKLLANPVNPRPLLPMAFLHRAHSLYLSSSGATMAGQLHALPAILRSCLEQAAYGHFIGDDYARWERWMSRHELRSGSQKDKWRKEFSHGAISRCLSEADPILGEIYKELYERTIDYGAHPNGIGASMGSHIEDLPDGGKDHQTLYLNINALMLTFGLKFTAQVGLCVLRIAREIYPSRMQALGVVWQLEDLCQRH